MPKVVLYHTDGCHLCEQAHALLSQCVSLEAIQMRDIIDDPQWLEAYQVRIPVVTSLDGTSELGWPFDLQQLQEFLSSYGSH